MQVGTSRSLGWFVSATNDGLEAYLYDTVALKDSPEVHISASYTLAVALAETQPQAFSTKGDYRYNSLGIS